MSDDKKNSEEAGAEGPSSAQNNAIPEVEAEIVEDPAMREGDLLKEAAPDSEASEGASDDALDDTVKAAAPPVRSRTPGVAIFVVFAVLSLAVLGFWLWQVRTGGAPASSNTPAEIQGQSRSEPLPTAGSVDEPSVEITTEQETGQAGATEADQLEPVSVATAPEKITNDAAANIEPETSIVDEAPSSQLPDVAVEGLQIEDAPLTEQLAEVGVNEDAAALGDEQIPDVTTQLPDEASPVEDGTTEGLGRDSAEPEAEISVASARDNEVVAETGSDNENATENVPVEVAAAVNTTEQLPETLSEDYTLEIERLSTDLEAEREKNAAHEAEMAALRERFDETNVSREAEADAALAVLRTELETAQRALATRPEAASAATTAFIQLTDAVEAGGPFVTELDAVAAFASDDATLEPLRSRAGDGVSTRQELKVSFREAARKALAAAGQDEAEGVMGNLEARMKSLISVRPSEPQQGNSPRAVMSRIEDAVRRDAFTLALSQIADLPAPAQLELQDWTADARVYEDMKRALTALNGALLAQAVR